MHSTRALRGAVLGAVISLLLATPATSGAQVAYDGPKGRVEVLGLRRWTLAMLRDSIRHYAPGQDLHDAACMVTLRDSLHFAEASVEWFVMDPPGEPQRVFLSVKVVEPEQASRVQWDVRSRADYWSLLPAYASVILPVTDSAGFVGFGRLSYWLQFRDSAGRQREVASASASERADAERLFGFLRGQREEGDRVRAVRVLEQDGFWVNRMVAVTVLSNFAADDSTWWTVARALRDPHEQVRSTALLVLRALPSRPIDWRPVAADLRLLLGGTNLLAMPRLMNVLARTSVAPDLAPVLLHDNGDWLLDHLASEAPMTRDEAHRLLVRLNAGRDLGPTRAAWAAWVQAL